MNDIERILGERLEEVGAQLAALEDERDRLRRALRALRDDTEPPIACAARAGAALPHAPPWQPDRLRR